MEYRFGCQCLIGSLAHGKARKNFLKDMFMWEIIETDELDEAEQEKRRDD